MRKPATVNALIFHSWAISRYSSYLIIALTLSTMLGCSTPLMVEKDGAGKRIDTSAIPNATPKPEPVTKAGNKSPYEVFGKTYWVLPNNKDYSETGVASWYGTKFHGRLTSNGEVYNMYGMTAAHKSLPIPSYAKVTNTENGRSIVVRINDRGPFHDERLIDLSYVGAMKLGYADRGTAKVLIEAIDTDTKTRPRQPQTTKTAKLTPTVAICRWVRLLIWRPLNSYRTKFAALPPSRSVVRTQDKLHKLWIGPIANNIELLSIKAMLKKTANLSAFSVTP